MTPQALMALVASRSVSAWMKAVTFLLRLAFPMEAVALPLVGVSGLDGKGVRVPALRCGGPSVGTAISSETCPRAGGRAPVNAGGLRVGGDFCTRPECPEGRSEVAVRG